MEQVHGVDVRWMSQGQFKEKFHNRPFAATDKTSRASPPPRELTSEPQAAARPQTQTTTTTTTTTTTAGKQNNQSESSQGAIAEDGPSIPSRHSKPDSTEKAPSQSNGAFPHHRRNSWFSNISAKFSGSSSQTASTPVRQQQQQQQQQQQAHQPPSLTQTQSLPQPISQASSSSSLSSMVSEPLVPRISTSRNAVLQHGSVPEGDAPYTPAPPKSGQAGFLGVFRRLSSSSGSSTSPSHKWSHGLVERKVLNVDPNRERCPISELKDNKLRRVSFCVDVEIAPMPKYTDSSIIPKPMDGLRKRMTEKGEGEALKNPKAAEALKEAEKADLENIHQSQETEETTPTTPTLPKSEQSEAPEDKDVSKPEADTPASAPKETTRKKEKKKKSEEERKARKEKRRKLAEANGSIPVEIQYDDSDSSDSHDGSGSPKSTSFPTTNPVRIYRRCCQLRESPILKRITEQLNDTANTSATTGFVNKIDLTGYSMQLADLITLGDYLAVVPVKEVVLDGIGLTDEGLRVILAGLLAAKQPEPGRKRNRSGIEPQGGVVERLSLKENDFGIDGWKHISLFIYRSKSLKQLDISKVLFPRQPAKIKSSVLTNGLHVPLAIAEIFAKSLAERPAGSMLEMVNMGETEPNTEQFGTIIDGLIQCGVTRLGVANNHLDKQGLQHVARYLRAGKCEGLDIGGNDLRGHMDIIASSLKAEDPLWAMSLAGCNLLPDSLVQILPVLSRLQNFRFIDLSHNRDLFDSKPNAVGALRRWLPKLHILKRLHLSNVNLTAEQAIAIVEVIPEVHQLCHINLLGNNELMKLAEAKTEEEMEEACALYASLMAATRISKSMMCVDIEVPSAEASEIMKAMAKQVVAYCLRNMAEQQTAEANSAVASVVAETHAEWNDGRRSPSYPHVIAHLVGHDILENDDALVDDDDDDDDDAATDEGYVIGGTGVVKALTFCLANRGVDSREQAAESADQNGGGVNGETSDMPGSPGGLKLATGGKAKDLSKHLLAGARKIRLRLQPALNKAKANPSDEVTLRKLMFLDETLQGVIKRFEDEFPETRETAEATAVAAATAAEVKAPATAAREDVEQPLSRVPTEENAAVLSDVEGEDETKIHAARPLSRTNSYRSRELAEEEGRAHRAGHKFRLGVSESTDVVVNALDEIGADPNHTRVLGELAEDIGGELLEKVKEKGVIRAFKEHRELTVKGIKESDLEYWPQFVEAQRKAQANMVLPETRQQCEAGEKNLS